MPPSDRTTLRSLIGACLSALLLLNTVCAEHHPSPDDIAMATQDPDEFAWQLFMRICRQAKLGAAGIGDPGKPNFRDYDDDRPIVWETWALSSGGRLFSHYVAPNRSEVFLDRGATPLPWDKLPRSTAQPKILEPFPGKGVEFLLSVGRTPGQFDPVEDGGEGGVEVRMNQGLYDYVRSNTLYNIEGLEQRVRDRKPIDAPLTAEEIKARWVPIEAKDKPRYHWRTVRDTAGNAQIWGLSALHVISRDLPNWFWCDFEHVDFEQHAEQYSRDTTTRGPHASHGSQGIRDETKDTKWQYMRLRGTQTNFVDAIGQPTILANSQIEHGFQQTSSCITCHARATVGMRVDRPDLPGWQADTLPSELPSNPVIRGAVGAPDPNWYRNDRGEQKYMQTHFMWSLPARALSTKSTPPSSTGETSN